MDQTLKALVRFLEEGTPELKIATAQVLGELAPKEVAVSRALADRLTQEEAFLTPFVLDALAQIDTKESIAVLVDRLHVGGNIAERVAHLLSQMGGGVTKALAPLFDGADAELRARLLAIIGRQDDRDALTMLIKALLHHDPGVSEKAAEVLEQRAPDLGEKEIGVLKTALDKALAANKVSSLTPVAIADALRVLGRIDGAKSRATLLRFATAKYEPIVRQAALEALEGVELTAAQAATLLAYVEEDDMTHVARPAMHALDGRTSWSTAAGNKLATMLEDDSEERRLFALRALRERRTETMGKACLQFLMDGAAEFQEAAIAALSDNPAALKALSRTFQLERNVDRAKLLARPMSALAAKLTPAQLKTLVEKAARLITSHEPLADPYLVVVGAAPKGPQMLVDKALRQRRAKRLEECLAVLLRLAQAEFLPDEGRYQLAVARLMADAQAKGAKEERREAGDATMGYFAALIRSGFPLFERLKKEGQLTPDDLLRVGRHFADGVAVERRVGGQLLHHVAERHGQKRAGEEAKLMLRAEGL